MRDNLKKQIQDLEKETFELIAMIQEILEDNSLYGPDNTYTFRNGERWVDPKVTFGERNIPDEKV